MLPPWLQSLAQDYWRDPLFRWSMLSLSVLLLILGLGRLLFSAPSDTPVQNHPLGITELPPGFSLVPIELLNEQSIASLVDRFAVVDLYRVQLHNGHEARGANRGKRIARNVRLLRAPLNPEKFAVLVPDNQAADLMGEATALLATVVNLKGAQPTSFENEDQPRKTNPGPEIQIYNSGGRK